MNTFSERFTSLYQLSRQVLDSAREGRWQHCIALAESYTRLLHAVMADIPHIRDCETSEALGYLVTPLLVSGEEIAGHIAKQSTFLKESMLMLQRGKQASQYYTHQEIALQSGR